MTLVCGRQHWSGSARSTPASAKTIVTAGTPVDQRVDRVDVEGGLLRASEVRLVVEIVSVGSRRMDHVIKRGEYADAGIPYYWIVDLDPPVTLLDCHLAGEFGY